jgi:hypothetical protein
MAEQLGVRASDTDRERTAAALREHFAQGRLGDDELARRLEDAYGARTTADLASLTADLPVLPPDARAGRAELAARRSELSRRLLQQTGAGFAPFLVCTVVWLVSGASGSFWPAWLLLVGAIPLVRNGWRLYGPAPDLEGVERELAARRAGGRRRPR